MGNLEFEECVSYHVSQELALGQIQELVSSCLTQRATSTDRPFPLRPNLPICQQLRHTNAWRFATLTVFCQGACCFYQLLTALGCRSSGGLHT